MEGKEINVYEKNGSFIVLWIDNGYNKQILEMVSQNGHLRNFNLLKL